MTTETLTAVLQPSRTEIFPTLDESKMVRNDKPETLISDDEDNDLQLGSDKKLLSKPIDTDFLAYYILAKG